ncbi:importin subunit alpha-B [Salpingoeca rosetta]|uniref:Importin subunit alpha-B n=1 Tax=Salpingoeca rosetta (strain ATCC 50818 / BSB-021) TaxID=946362 RepID=F2UBQ0_SALR5|nr:importin subunit alpha-B [Salpingoeca rosetta]EGD73916.1 importin subunit alpha-B [Salpingoeca rosetta]|eukprot:XP_004993479.1 importin subunit alpha-B [Salpingoeca rosetta]
MTDAVEKRVQACATELKTMTVDVSGLKRQLGTLRSQLFKVEMLRARRRVRAAALAVASAPDDEAADKALDSMTRSMQELELTRKSGARFDMYKNRGRGKQATQERLQATLAGLSNLREKRWSEERGIRLPRARPSPTKMPVTAPIPGQPPALPPLGDLQDIPNLNFVAANLKSSNPATLLEEVRRLRKALSREAQPPIDEVIQSGAVPYLVHLLVHDNATIQFEAAWALTNIASGNSSQTRVVIGNNGIPFFVHLLQSPAADVCDQAIWALGNISGDCPEYRDLCISHHIVPVLINILKSAQKVQLIRNAVWCLSNLCRGKPRPPFAEVAVAIPMLAQCIMSDDRDTVTDALWAISYLSDGANEQIASVLRAVNVRVLVEMLLKNDPQLVTPALRTLGNIVTGTDVQTQACIDAGMLPALRAILSKRDNKKAMLKEACWALSNITAGTREQIQAVLDAGLVPLAVDYCLNAPAPDVAKEALWVLSNMTSGGSPQQLRILVSADAVRAFGGKIEAHTAVAVEGVANLVNSMQADEEVIEVLVGLLEDEGVVDALQDCDHHQAAQVLNTIAPYLD